MRNRGEDVDWNGDTAAAAAAASARFCALAEDLEVQKKVREGVRGIEVGVAVLFGGVDVETSSPSNRRWVICGSAVM